MSGGRTMAGRPRRFWQASWMNYAYTLAIGVGLVYLLGLAFVTEQPAPPPARTTIAATVILLALPEGGQAISRLPRWQRDLADWINLRDPTLMSLPNDTAGFSEILRTGFERPWKSLREREISVDYASPVAYPPLAVVTPAPNPLAAIDAARMREPFRLPAVPPPPAVPPGVYFTHLDGEPFDRVPPFDTRALAELTVPLTCRRPTELGTVPRGRVVRVVVNQSSGNTMLDQLAAAHLRPLFLGYPFRQALTPDMEWWLSKRHTILVHWRFAPNVRDISDPANEDLPDDRSWY